MNKQMLACIAGDALFSSTEMLALLGSSPKGWFASKLPRRLRNSFRKPTHRPRRGGRQSLLCEAK